MQAQDEENNENATDEDDAASKFSHSLDDDDEDEENQDEDSNHSHNNKKKKEDDDEEQDDEKDDDDENKDKDDNDEDDDEKDKDDDEDTDNGDETNKDVEDDVAENLDDAVEDADDLIDDQEQKEAGQGDNTSDFDTNPDKKDEANPEEKNDDTEPNEEAEGGEGHNNSEDNLDGESNDSSNPLDTPEETGAGDAGAEGAESAAETAGKTGTEAAEAEGAGAAAEGAGAAAEGAGAAVEGGAAAAEGGAAVAGGGSVLLIAIVVILIIMIIIGVAGFFTTMPQFLWNRIKEFALDIWDGIQGYVIGMDEAGVNQDDIIVAAQYLYDMGYDLVGMGFAESVEIAGQKDENGNEIPVDDEHQKNEIISVDAPYLRSYLVAENRTYLINNYNYNLKNFMTSFFNGEFFSDDGHSAWGTGLINLVSESSNPLTGFLDALSMPFKSIPVNGLSLIGIEEGTLGELVDGLMINRETNQMKIRRINFELAFWKTHFDYTYYSLEGWTGRYGKPFELMITLHVATMAPDLVKEFALNRDLDAKVNVKLTGKKTISGEICVDGTPLSKILEAGTYDEDTRKWLKEVQKDKAEEIKTAMPYISSVTSHWFRNVYFEGTDSSDASGGKVGDVPIGVDNDGDGLEDFTENVDENGWKIQETDSLSAYGSVYDGGDVDVTLDYIGEDIPDELSGKSITITGSIKDGMIQTKEAVRGMTNPTTKEIFADKYYIYDGTVERAKAIQAARRGENNGVTKEKVNLTKDSLQAFTILENSDTLDAQFIYRDLKELVIELGYFEREDFYEIEKQVLEWPVPDYVPAEWPNKEIEKQVLEYGNIIACDETVAYALGMSLEELQKLTGTYDEEDDGEDDDEDTDEELDVLKGMTFIGDDYIKGLEENLNIEDAEYYYEGMFGTGNPGPQYWLDNIDELPSKLKKVVICTGVGDPREYEEMKGLIDALNKKYDYAIKIYVVEVLHVTENHTDADAVNKVIDTYNSHVRNKCKVTANATFIEASTGLVQNGYMRNGNSTGRVIASGEFERFAKNIARGINDNKNISNNPTDEQFVVDLLKSARQVCTTIKTNDFQYGNADYMPPRTNEKVDEANGTTDEDGNRKITTDRMISWALYKCGYKDQPENGLTVGEEGDFISYLEDKEWTKITNEDEILPGDIVFTDQIGDDETKASNVYLYAGNGKYFDCDSQEKISQTENNASQPIEKSISNFMCAYRVTGDGVINSGVKKDLDVIAMGNGKVTEILTEENNLFTEEYMTHSIYGDDVEPVAEEEEVPGREQSQEGVRIKLTDNALRGYVLIVYGFDVDSGISEGMEVKAGDIIGKTLDSDISIILIDRDKGVVDDVEEYIKVPKKTKETTRVEVDWEFYYWLPYESGPLGEEGVASETGAGACGTISGPDEVAVGIAQWTSYGTSCNNIPDLCKWLLQEDPSLCRPLNQFKNMSSAQIAGSFSSLKDAWNQVNNANPDKFLELQMKYFYEHEFMGWIESANVEWLLDKSLVAQGTYASLKNWAPNRNWEEVINSSMSDEEIVKKLLQKARPIDSSCGTLERRWDPQYVLAKDILSGTFTEVEEWVRTKQPSDKYGEGSNAGSLLSNVRLYFYALNDVYVADIKRKLIGGIYG